MAEKKQSPAGQQGQTQTDNKNKYSSRTIIAIRQIFISGNKITAKEINARTGSNDARKCISILRREGMNIQDIRMENRCKLYWWERKNNQQKNLFGDE
ncbi:hypothetical protein EZS27_023101 [termite gut metagenome]|uniref:Uncharacterized protein n=1 Tax=termite gut metagenome TaxID=433724 RepID=A0A5J4R3M5_9ZZZZ